MTTQHRPGHFVYRKLLLAFIHEGSSFGVRAEAADSLHRSIADDDVPEGFFFKAMVVPNQVPARRELVFMEADAVEFVGSENEYLLALLNDCPEIIGIMAIDLGEILCVPKAKFMTPVRLESKQAADIIRTLTYSLNLEITERINAAAELDQPSIHFIELRD